MTPDPLHDVEELASLATIMPAAIHPMRILRRGLRAFGTLLLFLFLALTGGFVTFITTLDEEAASGPGQADAIIALTGGSERISDALDLLATGHAQRLLITGVNPSTSPERLANSFPQHRDLFECCIDMDYKARNTVGNAIETRKWAEAREVHSIIVVTSSYHMPRAMLELQRAMPEMRLLPHAVTPERTSDYNSSRGLNHTKILATEYGKFIAAYMRATLFPNIATDQTATGSLRDKSVNLDSTRPKS